MVTGQDRISAELKNSNKRIDFDNFAKLLVLGNHFPKVEDNSLGWWDRVETLKFPNSFEGNKTIPNIENRGIPEELSGIFNWMLEGLYRLYEKNDFSSSKSTEETKTEFMRISDPFNAWILENCKKIKHAYLTREEALTDCEKYCEEIGADILTKKAFYEKMRNEPQVTDIKKRIGTKIERVFEGITLKKDVETQQPLESVADVAVVAESHIPETRESFINKEDKERATNATSATNPFYVQCFDCGKTLQKHEVYSFQGKTYCRECRLKIEDQKKGDAQ